ncbi:MAG: ABC transporter ATP-binding protein [Firmicutes bacterium]|nr:ABC transporter ATP-binding protein [Bacillota bacterium]
MNNVKELKKCIAGYKLVSVLSPLFVTLEVIMEVIIPLLMAEMIDKGINQSNMHVVLKVGILLVIAALMSLTFGTLSGIFAARASSGFAKNMRKKMFYRIQNYSFYNIDRFSTASLVTRLTTDVTNVQNAYQMIIRIAVRCPAMLIFSLVMAFKLNRRLSLVFLVMAPILIVGLTLIIRNAHPIFEKVFRTYDKLNAVVQENLRGIRVVKSFVREDFEENKFNTISDRIYQLFSKAEKILAINNPLMQFSVYTSIILISWFGAKFIVGGTMTTGKLTSMFTYTSQILMSLMMLSMVFVMITMSKASAERIAEVITEESDIKNCENASEDVRDGSIDFDDVCFSYTKDMNRPCLQNINLHIDSGETVGIIGGTGSAKSTLVQLIPRLYDVTSGSVKVGGKDVRDYDIEALRSTVAMVLQKNELFSGTISDNLRWGDKNATDDEIVAASKLAQADSFVEAFPDKYNTHIEQGGTNISGGQKQRLCIARAILKNPKILILDDSTSAVDTKTDALIRQSFAKKIPETTKIIIAQRISSVQDADKIIVLDNGKISGIGTHDELLKSNSIYREVYYSQIKGGDSDACTNE